MLKRTSLGGSMCWDGHHFRPRRETTGEHIIQVSENPEDKRVKVLPAADGKAAIQMDEEKGPDSQRKVNHE